MRKESLSTTPEEKTFVQRIAAINGIDVAEVDRDELREGYGRQSIGSPFFRKYVGQGLSIRSLAERGQTLLQLTEALLYLPPRYNSYGLFAPSYINGIEMHSKALYDGENPRKDSDVKYRSLLAGALTQDTIKEYAAVVKGVVPGAQCAVIDIQGDQTPHIDRNVASFAFGDAKRMPFADGSFDTIQTNYLMPNLRHTGKLITLPFYEQEKFFEEAYRVLSDTGSLMMVEQSDYIVKSKLENAGFPYLYAEPALEFRSRREMENLLTFRKYTEEYPVFQSRICNFYVASKIPLH